MCISNFSITYMYCHISLLSVSNPRSCIGRKTYRHDLIWIANDVVAQSISGSATEGTVYRRKSSVSSERGQGDLSEVGEVVIISR